MADRPAKMPDMNWLNPYIIVTDMERSIEFYERAFGFEKRMTMPGEDGKLIHAEMAYKGNVIMVGSEEPDRNLRAPNSEGGTAVSFYLYVDDVDGFRDKVKSSGGSGITELTDQFWGDRTFQITCPAGHQWTFAQNVEDFDPFKAPGGQK